MLRFRPSLTWLALAAALLLAACAPPPQVHTLSGPTMGTVWTVRLAGLPADVTVPQLRAEIEALLETANAQMSTYRDDTEITRFNRAPAGTAVTVSEDFARVLAAALALAEDTGGAYDPTVGPLVNLWGFGPDGHRDRAPEDAAIAAMRDRVGWRRLDFDAATRRLVQPGGVYLDLSSIAKGDAVDRIVEHLAARGVAAALVDIGGDMRLYGRKPDGSGWRVAIERPVSGPRDVHTIIEPGDRAVATSGSYRNFFRDGGREFSHTIDPRTGHPVVHELVSVTVIDASCLQADALATALTVLGPEEGYAFAEARGLAVLLLVREGDAVAERMTPAFARYLERVP